MCVLYSASRKFGGGEIVNWHFMTITYEAKSNGVVDTHSWVVVGKGYPEEGGRCNMI